MPEFEGDVGVVLVLDLEQSAFATAVDITLELGAFDEWKTDIDAHMEAVLLFDMVEYGVEDDEQFFVEVDLSLLIDGIEIDGRTILQDGLRTADSACPVDLVVSRVNVLEGKSDEVLMVAIELDERQ